MLPPETRRRVAYEEPRVSEQTPPEPADDVDLEAPPEDAAEQRMSVGEDLEDPEPGAGELPDEVDPADRLEQERSAGPDDEDEYR
jgi:hypothetical protein